MTDLITKLASVLCLARDHVKNADSTLDLVIGRVLKEYDDRAVEPEYPDISRTSFDAFLSWLELAITPDDSKGQYLPNEIRGQREWAIIRGIEKLHADASKREHPSVRRLLIEARECLARLCGSDGVLTNQIDVVLEKTAVESDESPLIKALNETAADLADERRKLVVFEQHIEALTKARDHWKSNHDNQVAIKAAVLDRPDLGDRAKRVQELVDEVARQKAHIEDVTAQWRRALAIAADVISNHLALHLTKPKLTTKKTEAAVARGRLNQDHHTKFCCPKCGSSHFGSNENEDGTLTRPCHGEFGPCDYKGHQSEDVVHFEQTPVPEYAPEVVPPASGWIRFDEQKPKVGQEVFAARHGSTLTGTYEIVPAPHINHNGMRYWVRSEHLDGWQPLVRPEAPKSPLAADPAKRS